MSNPIHRRGCDPVREQTAKGCRTEPKQLAGGRRAIVEAVLEKEARQRRSRGSEAWIETTDFQNGELRNGSDPLDRVAIQVLPHTLGRRGLCGHTVRVSLMKDSGGEAGSEADDGEQNEKRASTPFCQ